MQAASGPSSSPTTEPRWRGKLRTLVTMAAVSTHPLPDSPTTASVTTCTATSSALLSHDICPQAWGSTATWPLPRVLLKAQADLQVRQGHTPRGCQPQPEVPDEVEEQPNCNDDPATARRTSSTSPYAMTHSKLQSAQPSTSTATATCTSTRFHLGPRRCRRARASYVSPGSQPMTATKKGGEIMPWIWD